MQTKLNTKKALEECRKIFNNAYDVSMNDILSLQELSDGKYCFWYLIFKLGYYQGYKAKTAELKKPSRHFNNA